MASNPTPRAYLGDLCNIDKSRKAKVLLKNVCLISKDITQNKTKQSMIHYLER
jgi:hypothetical protein